MRVTNVKTMLADMIQSVSSETSNKEGRRSIKAFKNNIITLLEGITNIAGKKRNLVAAIKGEPGRYTQEQKKREEEFKDKRHCLAPKYWLAKLTFCLFLTVALTVGYHHEVTTCAPKNELEKCFEGLAPSARGFEWEGVRRYNCVLNYYASKWEG